MKLEIEIPVISAQAIAALERVQKELDQVRVHSGKADDAVKKVGTGANVQGFTASVQNAGQSLGQFSTGIEGIARAVGGLYVLNVASQWIRDLARAAVETVSEVIQLGDSLQNVSEKTGISVQALSELRFAAEQSEVDFQQLSIGIRFLNRNLAEAAADAQGPAAEAFEKLGVSVLDGSKQIRSVEDILPAIADGLRGLSTDAERTAAAMAIFGRSGEALIPLLGEGSIALTDMMEKARALGLTMDPEAAKAAAALDDSIDALNSRIEALKVEAVEPLLPVLKQAADDILILSQEAKKPDPGPLVKFAQEIVIAFSPLAVTIGAATALLEALHVQAKKTADEMKRVADEMANTSRIGEIRLQEQKDFAPTLAPIIVGAPAPPPRTAIGVTPPDWEEIFFGAGVEAGAMEDARIAAERQRRAAAAQQTTESDAFVQGLTIYPELADAQKNLNGILREQVSKVDALDAAFNDLARVAELAHNKTLAVVAALASFAIEMVKLIQSLTAGPAGGGGGGFWQLIGSAFGAGALGGGAGAPVAEGAAPAASTVAPKAMDLEIEPLIKESPSEKSLSVSSLLLSRGSIKLGDSSERMARAAVMFSEAQAAPARIAVAPLAAPQQIAAPAQAPLRILPAGPPIEESPAERLLAQSSARLMRSSVELSRSSGKLAESAADVSALGGGVGPGGVAPLGPARLDIPTGSARAIGGNLAGMAGAMGVGIPAVVGMGQLLGTLLSMRNQEFRDNLDKFRDEFFRQQVEGGEWLSTIMQRGGWVESYLAGGHDPLGEGSAYGGGLSRDLPPPRPPITYPSQTPTTPPEERPGRGEEAMPAKADVTVNVSSLSNKWASEYFKSDEFSEAMRYATSVRSIE